MKNSPLPADLAVRVDNVSKIFRVYHERNQSLKSALMRRKRAAYEDFLALDQVSLDIKQGETFAIIGDNGSGKSTLLKCMAKILTPNTGKIYYRGRLAALLEVGSGFHPELSGRENIFLNGSILGMSKAEISRKFDDIVGFSGVENFIDEPVKNYSSGMYVRLGFSVAVHVDPEILLVDEVLAVGDAAFQRKCAAKFAEFKASGRTVVVVAHSAPILRQMCSSAVLLEKGKVQTVGEANTVLDLYEEKVNATIAREVHGIERWGSGEVKITRISMQTLDGKILGTNDLANAKNDGQNEDLANRTVSVQAGSQLELVMDFQAESRVERPQFAFALDTEDGQRLWGGDTRFENPAVHFIDGSGQVRVRVNLPLREGAYILHGSILDQHTVHNYDFVRNALLLEVTQIDQHAAGGPIWVAEDWHLRSACPGQPLLELPREE